jgi:hypothetical protein
MCVVWLAARADLAGLPILRDERPAGEHDERRRPAAAPRAPQQLNRKARTRVV